MHVKLQTWFPFLIQVYINGREMIRHVFGKNGVSYQMYDNSFFEISDIQKAQELADKFSCLRVETTVNDPKEFKVYKDVHLEDGSASKRWVPMGKSIANLYRYAEISKAANKRFLDSMQNIIPAKTIEKEINSICSRKKSERENLQWL